MSGITSLVSIPMFSSDITELEVKANVAELNTGLSPSGIESYCFEELFRSRILALPFSSAMTKKQVDTVCNSLKQIL